MLDVARPDHGILMESILWIVTWAMRYRNARGALQVVVLQGVGCGWELKILFPLGFCDGGRARGAGFTFFGCVVVVGGPAAMMAATYEGLSGGTGF